ncbi:MAG TPA: hypothetical protein VM431_07060 [Phycisphaerae bacterium]|nr:hypothetical protein [Phycisphaerae bacterium]
MATEPRARIAAVAVAVVLMATAALRTDAAAPAKPKLRPVPTAEKTVPRDEVPDAKANLIANGDFETPADDGTHPAHWQAVDNLVFFWTTDAQAPERGKVIRVDTDVYQSQAYQWWIDRFVRGKPLAEVPTKTPTSGLKYDTIGGLDGGWYWSDFIEVKKGGAYKVYVDVKGPGCLVFIRGYEKKLPISFGDEAPAAQEQFRKARGDPLTDKNGRPVKYYLRYRYTAHFGAGGSDEWQTYTHIKPRHPNSRDIIENVRYIRIMLYPFWPAATYWFDNVRVVEVPPDADQARPKADEADVEEGKVVR